MKADKALPEEEGLVAAVAVVLMIEIRGMRVERMLGDGVMVERTDDDKSKDKAGREDDTCKNKVVLMLAWACAFSQSPVWVQMFQKV